MNTYFLNFFECELSSKSAQLWAIDYADQHIRDLTNKYPNTHFYRYGDQVFYWEKSSESSLPSIPGSKLVSIDIEKQPKIFSRILELGIVERIKERQSSDKTLRVRKNLYSGTWEIISHSKSIFRGEDRILTEGMDIHKRVHINTFFSNGDQFRLGLLISLNLKNRLTWSKTQLEEKGVSTNGLSGVDEAIFPSREAIKRFTQARGCYELVNQTVSRNVSTDQGYKDINRILDSIAKDVDNIYLPGGIKVRFSNRRNLPLSSTLFSLDSFSPPDYVFDGGQIANSGRLEDRLKRYKPATFWNFNNEEINIGVLSPKEYQGHLELFVSEIVNRLQYTYHLREVKIMYNWIRDKTIDS